MAVYNILGIISFSSFMITTAEVVAEHQPVSVTKIYLYSFHANTFIHQIYKLIKERNQICLT